MRTLFILILFIPFSQGFSLALSENPLTERDYWKNNPTLEQVKQAVSEGYDPTELNRYAFDPISWALIEKCDNDVVKYLLTFEGNDVNKLTHDSRTYIFWAAYKGNLDLMQHLLELGADTKIIDSHGYSVMNFCAVTGLLNTEVYDFCFKHGASIKEVNRDGANALLLVAPFISDFNLINYFIQKGASLTDKDDLGNGLFNYAAKRGNVELLEHLISMNVSHEIIDKNGENALFKAASATRRFSNGVEVFEFLQSKGLSVTQRNNQGENLLHILSHSNPNPAVYSFLMKAGVSNMDKDENSNIPLHAACSYRELDVIHALQFNSASIQQPNDKGMTPFDLALANNEVEICVALKSNSKITSVNPLAIHELINNTGSQNIQELHSKLDLIESIPVDFNTVNESGETILHRAALNNHEEVVNTVLHLGVDANAKNNENYTPLHLACMKADNFSIIELLIENGADKTLKTEFGENAFDLAMENELLPYSVELENLLK